MKKIRGLILFSGGLDSILAAKLLEEQRIELLGLAFKSLFFDVDQAEKSAKQINLPLKIIDISKEHLAMVKQPRFGYGSAMNPCIDCHLMMFKKAAEIMKNENYDFVASGEVLGERPMSQNKQALQLIEKESGIAGYLLRPLSAELFESTIPEKKGLIDRKKLLGISGRSRKPQMMLAKKFNIQNYPTPAGGCLLCDIEFGKRLKELFQRYPECDENDVELLKYGHHFWVDGAKVIVGRNHQENLEIKSLAREGDCIIELKEIPGPTVLVRGKKNNKQIESKAIDLLIKYSPKAYGLKKPGTKTERF